MAILENHWAEPKALDLKKFMKYCHLGFNIFFNVSGQKKNIKLTIHQLLQMKSISFAFFFFLKNEILKSHVIIPFTYFPNEK